MKTVNIAAPPAGGKKDDKMIVIGMGNLGKTVRILSPILGSQINFLSGNQKTALGQLDLETWQNLESDLKKYL